MKKKEATKPFQELFSCIFYLQPNRINYSYLKNGFVLCMIPSLVLFVFISEENRPIIWQSVRVSSKAMVLSCDEASLCTVVCARLGYDLCFRTYKMIVL